MSDTANRLHTMSQEEAIETIVAAAEVFLSRKHHALGTVAVMLDCSPLFLQRNLQLFPNRWRLGIEWRIPDKDVQAYIRERQVLSRA